MRALPRIVVAGTRSGVGKTSVATGLMAALAARGHTVSGHKVGPDFIDPSYHALATSRPPRNLDAFLHGHEHVAPLLVHGAAGADIAVIEGVMGLFDGRSGTSVARHDEASTAHVAALTATPVVLVVDAAATSRSVAAEVHGFATWDPAVTVAGVVLNKVGSDRHERLLRDALAPLGVEVLGVLRRDDRLATPSRHLGLVPAAERAGDAQATVAALGEHVARSCDLDALVRLARTAPALDFVPWSATDEVARTGGATAGRGSRPVVTVAGGRAFTFVYTEHLELLAAAGARVAVVDPLIDTTLPEHTAALYLGGGFPETHAEELSANVDLRREVARHAAAGRPVVAECGGLAYLARSLDGTEMCGVLDVEATFTDRLTLGYRTARLAADGPLGPAGTPARGHEHHRTTVTAAAAGPAWHLDDGRAEGIALGNVVAGYLHTSWVGQPSLATAFVDAARAAAPAPEVRA